ncbi:MAG: hypothetical protein GF344_07565 [Chitinivibrionales bacterium]|nr:hypothetical protein [Chitinivibrionales bacterium]MBD3356756.1 hypothetical protein [Chitinivibrionales bacterium]
MRVQTVVAHVMLAAGVSMAAAQVSGSEGTRNGVEDRAVSPCLRMLGAIQRQSQSIERGRDRLTALLRVAGESDRETIEEYGTSLSERMERLQTSYADLAEELRSMSEQEIEISCGTYRARLVSLRDRIHAEVVNLKRFESKMRDKIATTKRLARALRITDDMLVKATRISTRTGEGEDAFPGLRRAYELQENAKQALAAGRAEAAMRMTLKARDILGRTLDESLDDQDIEHVRRHAKAVYERTEQAVERLSQEIDTERNPKAARMIEVAENDLAKARELIRKRPYIAIRHVEHARRVIHEMRRFHRRSNHCEERIVRLEERIEHAQDIVDQADDEKAVEVLTRAEEHYVAGVELCETGESKKATVQLDIAAKLTARAVELAKDITRGDKAMAREIRKTGYIVKKAESVATSDEEKRLVAQSRELIAEAKERIDQPRVSLKLLDKATDLAFRVIARAQRSNPDASTGSLEQ